MYNGSIERANTMQDLKTRLRERARIRRSIPNRKSVQEGQPDRIADLLEEAANKIEELENEHYRSWSPQS
jgi:hypothetical protein